MVAKRKRLQVEVRRDELLRLGAQLFLKVPYDQISIDDLSRRLKISKGLLYHYFSSKKEFYLEVIKSISKDFLEKTEVAPEQADPSELLKQNLDLYLSYVERHRPLFLALHRSGAGADAKAQAIVESNRRKVFDQFAAVLGSESMEPSLRLSIWGAIGLIESTAVDWAKHGGMPREALREMLWKMCLATIEVGMAGNLETD